MRIEYFVSAESPPLSLISSVRAVIFRNEEVLVVRDEGEKYHIVPGGRREADETIEQTLRREVLEETGWQIGTLKPLGYAHFRHLTPKPSGYKYPYPDFYWLYFVASAETFEQKATLPGAVLQREFVYGSNFIDIKTARQLKMDAAMKSLLDTAYEIYKS